MLCVMGCAWVVSVKQLEQHINNFHNWFCLFHNLGGTVLRFFIGKMDQEMAVFWSKTELLGQFCVFFLNDN